MRLLNLLCATVALGILGGCNTSPQNQPQPSANSVTTSQFPKDDLGREIKLSAPAQRVVCIGPGATETIFSLGAQDKLVGRDQFSDYPAATKNIAIAGDYTGPFVEKAVALKPDLIIVQGETYDKTRAENWQQKIGVPVAILVPTNLEKVAGGIEKLGQWLNQPNEASKLATALRSTSNIVYKDNTDAFIEIQRSPPWTAGKGTLTDDMLQRGGFKNVFEDVVSYKQVNREALITRQPAYYIVTSSKLNPTKDMAQQLPRMRAEVIRELKQQPGLQKLECVQAGRVLVLPGDWLLRPSPRLQKGIDELRRQHGELAPKLKN